VTQPVSLAWTFTFIQFDRALHDGRRDCYFLHNLYSDAVFAFVTGVDMKTHPPHQQLTSSQRYLITRVARLMYSMNAHNVTRSQQLSLARKAAPELPELMREICVIASKTCFVKATKNIQLTINKISRRQSAIKRDTRDVCRYPPTSDDLGRNNNDDSTPADNMERLPIELLSQTDMDISGKLDDFNKSQPPDITGGPESSQLEERREEFRQYPLDKIRQNYTVKKATSSAAATSTMTATGASSRQLHTGAAGGQLQHPPTNHHNSVTKRRQQHQDYQLSPVVTQQDDDVDLSSAEHLTSTPSRARIPITNDPVVKQRAETYQRTNVAAPAYEEHGTPAFQRLTTEAQDPPTYHYNSVTKRRQQQPNYQLSREDQQPGDNNGDFEAVIKCLKAIWDQRAEKHPTTSSRQVRNGQSVTRHGDTNWARDRPGQEQRPEGTSESCSNYDSDWNDRDERTSRNRDQSGGRSITFYRGTNWSQGYRARRGGRNRLHSRGEVARPNRVTDWRRDVHEGHEREGSSTVCHGRANSTHARRRF